MLDLVDKEVLSQPIFRGDPFPIETKWTTALLLRSERAFSHKRAFLSIGTASTRALVAASRRSLVLAWAPPSACLRGYRSGDCMLEGSISGGSGTSGNPRIEHFNTLYSMPVFSCMFMVWCSLKPLIAGGYTERSKMNLISRELSDLSLNLQRKNRSSTILITTNNHIESRKYSTSSNVHHLCSLENLSMKIDSLYSFCPERFKLDYRDVKKIKDKVLSGCYRISPFHLRLLVVVPEESDKLVLTALGAALNEIFGKMGYNAIQMQVTDFYENILKHEGRFQSLYRFDMTRSLITIDQSSLIIRLESILGSNPFFDLVLEFLKNEIDYIEIENIEIPQFSIPPAGLLTNVLLNFELFRLDNEIASLYPDIYQNYRRHIHEIYIYNCNREKEISSLFVKLCVEGNLHYIKPGLSAKCFVGNIGLTQKGRIYVKYGL
ncbi:hypothetical protein OROHE_025391 [Orobanche hederae]